MSVDECFDYVEQVRQNIHSRQGKTVDGMFANDDVDGIFNSLELCGATASKFFRSTVKQFQQLYKLPSDTILVPCDEAAHQHIQPCSCQFVQYKSKAHIFFSCEACGLQPIVGDMYICGKCADPLYNVCADCYEKDGHDCGAMDVLSTPFQMISKASDNFIAKYKAIPVDQDKKRSITIIKF